MTTFNWIPWLLAICFCIAEARYKMRRPLPPSPLPPPQIYKKSWPIGHRMSMGNTIHIGNNYPPKRPIFNKPSHYRLRPPPMFNMPPTQWKNPIPVLAPVPNLAVIPQRPPVKEFTVMNKVPEYSPEYRPELIALPQTHRGDIDDDRGPIHTIPAPNLSLADKPYYTGEENNGDNNQNNYRRHPNDNKYNPNGPAISSNHEFGGLGSGADLQRPVTNPTSPQNYYEVTKVHDAAGEFQTVVPTFFPPEFESSRVIPSGVTSDVQTNELYLNHPPISRSGVVDTNIKFGHSNIPMQTNLHSSLHVGFPGTGAQASSLTPSQMSDIHIGQQAPDLHVGHPAASGPPLSANQLYDLLNSFPQPLVEQYTTDQQPQLQQHLLQQQLNQLIQSETNPTSFSQPQMHSFNYDEQAAKQQLQQQQQQQQQQLLQEEQQQQLLFGQDYISASRVTADNNLASKQPLDPRQSAVDENQDIGYQSDNTEQTENNIEYEAQDASTTVNQAGSENYFSTIGNDGVSMSTQFYTTLPNRETAEKLAALAAAGNVNSHLLGQLKKQKEQQQQSVQQNFNDENQQNDEPIPSNHNYQVNEQVDDIPHESQQGNGQQSQKSRYGPQKRYRQRYRQQQIQQEQEIADKHYEQQKFMQEQREQEEELKSEERKRPLRIMVPEVEQDDNYRNLHSNDNTNDDYEYDNSEFQMPEVNTTLSHEDSTSEFGSRIRTRSDM